MASGSGLLHSHLSVRIIKVLRVSRISLSVSFCLELLLGELKLILGNLEVIGCTEKVLQVGTLLGVCLAVVDALGGGGNDLVEILGLFRFGVVLEGGVIENVILLKVVSLILIGERRLWHQIKSLHLVLLRNAAREATLELSDVLVVGLLRHIPGSLIG